MLEFLASGSSPSGGVSGDVSLKRNEVFPLASIEFKLSLVVTYSAFSFFFFQIWLDRWFGNLFFPLFLSVFLFWVSVPERHFFEWGSFQDQGLVRSGGFLLGVLNFVRKIWRF